MKKVKCFVREESASYPGKYIIKPLHDNFYLEYTEGSYNVICARLFSLSYADYLRMCRDCFGAEIIGKGSKYPVAYFTRGEQLEMLLAHLNARANLVLWEREHPNFEEHASFVQEKNPEFYTEITTNARNS